MKSAGELPPAPHLTLTLLSYEIELGVNSVCLGRERVGAGRVGGRVGRGDAVVQGQ